MIIPGVQNPHCTAPYSAKAFCRGCSVPSAASSPSMVTTSAPSTSTAGKTQEFTATPSTRTVQAPQSPPPQPSLDPMRSRSSLRMRRRLQPVRTATLTGSPFTKKETTLSTDAPMTDPVSLSTLIPPPLQEPPHASAPEESEPESSPVDTRPCPERNHAPQPDKQPSAQPPRPSLL